MSKFEPNTQIIWRVNQQGQKLREKTGVVVKYNEAGDSVLCLFQNEDGTTSETWVGSNNIFEAKPSFGQRIRRASIDMIEFVKSFGGGSTSSN